MNIILSVLMVFFYCPSRMVRMLKKKPLALTEWDERLWITLLNTATAHHDGKIVFHFKSGAEITA